jgi:hypothetical protein
MVRRIPLGLAACPIIPYPTGRFFRGGFPRHFVPGYDRIVPPGRPPMTGATGWAVYVLFSVIRILLVVLLLSSVGERCSGATQSKAIDL